VVEFEAGSLSGTTMIRKLEHANILTTKLADTIRFYTDVLGMKNGPTPVIAGMTSGGTPKLAWIYDQSGTPVLHLQAVNPDDPEEALSRVRSRLGPLAGSLDVATLKGGAAIEHLAFECTGYDELRDAILAARLELRQNAFPGLRQIFVNDPNGITLELNFHE
jgi:catechol 2,3-dioxygenase-like lactoylglutathione lyase family enzyme